ncbi:MAG: trigger factor [Elusimicrobiota bacterium]
MENIKVNVLEKKGCTTELKVEISADEFKKELDAVYNDIQKNAAIDGFRKGRVPIEFVKKEFAKTAITKTVQNLLNSATEQIIKQHNYQLVSAPVVEPSDIEDGKPFSFKLKIEQIPEFEVKDYKKLKLIKKIKKITEKEIHEVIKNLQERQSTLVDEGNVAVEPHHFLVADYEGTIDGKKIEKPAENQIIDLSHQSLPAGFATGLIGMKVGESKTIETKIADKPAQFDVKLKSIKKKVLPEIDDEFAKDLGHENIKQLKERIKTELIKADEEKSRQDLENQIVETLLKSNDFPVPETLVEEEINSSIERTKQYLISNRSYNEDEFTKSIPAMRDRYKSDAEKTVKISYILSRIAKNENITVTDEEIDKKIEELAGGDKKNTEGYQKHREYLSLRLKEQKLFDLLLANAKIKEVTK